MARLTTESGDGETSRGQLLLVTAFALAVLFVTLAAVLNAAVTIETTAASAQGTAIERDVARYQYTVREEVSSLVVWVNHNASASTTALSASVGNWSELAARHAAAGATGAGVTVNDTTDGTRLVQDNSTRQLFNATNDTDWTLATDASVRRFEMNLSRDSLNATADPESDAYTASFTGDGGSTWQVFVYRNDTDDLVVKSVRDGTSLGTCEVVNAPANVTIDVTGGTVEGTTCDALVPFAPDVSAPYDVAFENGDEAAGTYELVVDSGVVSENFGDQPYTTDAIYAATVRLSYRTSDTTYVTTIRVAPGEPA